ncbi:V-type ATP synthase subunit K [Cloacibacillus porcorum]|jgi:V/A-type H+/Na+-transporting ATPase subunit K|uniref:Permease n=1 Tax=Cloacibacillus porcorum TaxID=1197717 RepID=A0A1B2I4M0_9BACT|nr:V-type ATP synthase subunit K [Cloacibacillus porcorum]ANZ44921.1 permease [Cloacibacillus porcorum]MCC8185750.1 V-type ATP synthase subunit K [Cloacibacillus porcorum]MCD7876666.1 V-type ATP synthase subunit K [Cloacibacillus porcorum]MCD8233914.1 V-type ATP synthase subunit K [Cloacibacillus porcorum]MCD8392951.1 V-type ATP synthase subunit K [Cloacibacillus porcorum]
METILATMADQLGQMLVILGGALAVGFAGSGSAWGIGIANEAAAGVMTEDPKKFGYALVLLALPGTQGIYGLLVAVLAMQKAGLLGGAGAVALTVWQGFGICCACLPIAISGFYSAIWQGKSSAATILMIAKRPEQIGKAVILPAMCETYAVFGLLVSILMLNGIKL